jgi:chromosome segregation protein
MPSRLKSLDLLGYKTFASKSQFVFGDKITAIVGPNGSGKSNIVDSIRWVLGEQSFSLLRGKKTEDMIFAGSELRPRASMAQTTVTFDNSDGWLPIDFSEVSITRRAYRDGQNEYLLNNQRTRLRDIAELLGKVGLAERTYTIVGQGLVDSALSLKADERRALFEEAAGIGIYRAKREDALRKLEQTQHNLERVQDILAEIRPRLRTLERQAQRARDYNQVKAELDGVLKIWYGFHWHEAQKNIGLARKAAESQAETLNILQKAQHTYDHTLADLRAKINLLRRQLHEWGREETRLRTEAETLNRTLAVADERLRSFAEQRDALAVEIAALETELATQRTELASARADLDQLIAEREAARAQAAELESIRAGREAERKALAQHVASSQKRLAELSTQLAERQARRAGLAAQREQWLAAKESRRSTLAQAEAQLAALQNVLTDREARAAIAHTQLEQGEAAIGELTARIAQLESARADLGTRVADAIAQEGRLTARADVLAQTRAGLDGESAIARLKRAARENRFTLHAEFADLITVPLELDAAISAALGQHLSALVLDEPNTALDLLADVEGRAALLPLNALRPAPLTLPDPITHPNVLGLASELVTCDPAHRAIVDSLLGRAVIVRDRETAQLVAGRLTPGAAAITVGGEIFQANGAIIGGRDSASATLALAREARALPEEIARARARREALETERDGLDSTLLRLRDEAAAATAARLDLQTADRAAAAARDGARLDLDRAQAQAELHRDQLQALETQIATAQAEETALTLELESLTAAMAEAEAAARAAAAEALGLAEDDLADKVAERNTAAAVAARAADDASARLAELQRALERTQSSIAARHDRINTINDSAEQLLAGLANDRAQLSNLQSLISNLQSQITPAERHLTALETELAAAEAAESAARAELHIVERNHADAQLDYARKKDELELLRRQITDDFGLVALDYTEELAGPTPLPFEGIVEHLPQVETLPEGLEDLLNRRRGQLRRMGAINPDALNEFNEVKERNEFLTTQVDDLNAAAAQLREVIAELDLLMEREFRKTFEAVAEQFKDTFARLFGGGSARLVLTEPENIASTGIDIVARLPGRKQQGLALLSGGERALTASALIFALLRVNPPPFAMLDEMDAALDEANVGRFRDMLAEMSQTIQIVIITHNRSTVQAADTVYGISMGADSASQAISLRLDGEAVVKG